MKPRRPHRPQVVDVPMDDTAVLAIVAAIALDPRCPLCGGPAELRPSSGGAVDVYMEHRAGCKALQDQRSRP